MLTWRTVLLLLVVTNFTMAQVARLLFSLNDYYNPENFDYYDHQIPSNHDYYGIYTCLYESAGNPLYDNDILTCPYAWFNVTAQSQNASFTFPKNVQWPSLFLEAVGRGQVIFKVAIMNCNDGEDKWNCSWLNHNSNRSTTIDRFVKSFSNFAGQQDLTFQGQRPMDPSYLYGSMKIECLNGDSGPLCDNNETHTDFPSTSTTRLMSPSTTFPSNASITEKLEILLNRTVTQENVVEIAGDLLDVLLSESTLITSTQIELAAGVVDNVVSLQNLPVEASKLVLNCTDVMLSSTDWNFGTVTANTTSWLRQSFNRITDNTNLTTGNYFFFAGANVGFVLAEFNCSAGGNDSLVGMTMMGKSDFDNIWSQNSLDVSSQGLCSIEMNKQAMCSQNKTVKYSFKIIIGEKLYADQSSYKASCSKDLAYRNKNDQNATVMSAYISGEVVSNTAQIVTMSVVRPLQIVGLHASTTCGYWDEISFMWSTDGCQLSKLANGAVKCTCDHLTDFAILIDTQNDDSLVCDAGLVAFGTAASIISCLSLAAMCSYIIYVELTKRYFLNNKQVNRGRKRAMQFAYSGPQTYEMIAFYLTIFLFNFMFALLSDQHSTGQSDSLCASSAAFLHWLLLCIFFMGAVRALHFYRMFVLVFRKQNSILSIPYFGRITMALSLGIPALIIIGIRAGQPSAYQRGDGFCWLMPTMVVNAVIVPATLALFVTLCLFIAVAKSLWASVKLQSRDAKTLTGLVAQKAFQEFLATLVKMQLMLGLPWVMQYFTFITIEPNAFHYLFTFLNGFQGLWILLIHLYLVYRKRTTRRTGQSVSFSSDSKKTSGSTPIMKLSVSSNALQNVQQPKKTSNESRKLDHTYDSPLSEDLYEDVDLSSR